MAEQKRLSIVITSCTTERIKDIFELLDSIKDQTYPQVETIFVAEKTHELYDQVHAYAKNNNLSNLRLIFNDTEFGLSASRNKGINEATGEIIAFVDDDTILYPDWAEEMINAYSEDSIIGVTGPAFPLWENETMAWFPEEFYWIVSCTSWNNWKTAKTVRNAWGMNMSFRKAVFEECGGFSNEYGFHKGPMAEDNEFSLRVRKQTGKSIMYSPNVKVWHKVYTYRLTGDFIKKRSMWIGYTRRIMRTVCKDEEMDTDLLQTENQLLKRIAVNLLPLILKGFFENRVMAWRRLAITTTVLFHVTIGYYVPFLTPFDKSKQPIGGNK